MEPTELPYPSRAGNGVRSSTAPLGWLLVSISLIGDILATINYLMALHAAHTYMTDQLNKAIAFIMVLAPVLELNVGLAIVGACLLRSNAGRLIGSFAVLAASASMVVSILLAYGIPEV